MKPLLLPLLVLVVAAILVGLSRRRWTGVGSIASLGPRPLLTENEKEFYQRLRMALPDCEVMAQVAMGALLRPIGVKTREDYFGLRGRYAQKIVDFVICDRVTLEPIAIVELDDRTHDAAKDRARDAMLTSAGYRVVRWSSRQKPGAGEIAAAIRNRER